MQWSGESTNEIDVAVENAIIDSMVDDPKGFTKELDEVLRLCGVVQTEIAKAYEILSKLKFASQGSDLFMATGPRSLILLINTQRNSAKIKYYIILNSQIRKLNATLKTETNPEPLKEEMYKIVNEGKFLEVTDMQGNITWDKFPYSSTTLNSIYTEIYGRPITFAAKKWLLSAVLEKMLKYILEQSDLNEYNEMAKGLEITSPQLLEVIKYLGAFMEVDFYKLQDLPKNEQSFDKYIDQYMPNISDYDSTGLYKTLKRAFVNPEATDGLNNFGIFLATVRINSLLTKHQDKTEKISYIFKGLKNSADSINKLSLQNAGVIFEGMLKGIKIFFQKNKDKSLWNTYSSFLYSSDVVTEDDIKLLENYHANVENGLVSRFFTSVQTAQETKQVADTIKHIEALRDQAKDQVQTAKSA